MNINYGTHELQQLKTLKGLNSDTALVFIHGGAWVYPNNNFDDFDTLFAQLQQVTLNKESATRYSECYSINYRLSPEVQHPYHLLDTIFSLIHLSQEKGVKNISLVGHSVGSILALQLLNYRELLELCEFELDALRCYTTVPRELDSRESLYQFIGSNLPTIDFAILLSGIYDIPDLVEEYESYESWVSQAFHKGDYSKGSQLTSGINLNTKTEIHICQSFSDELVSVRQQNLLTSYLQSQKHPYKCYLDEFGSHDDVFKNQKIGEYILKVLEEYN